MKPPDSLLTQLLLKHPDATDEEYSDFFRQLINHRFSRLLHLYEKDSTPLREDTPSATLPVELEISHLIEQEHSEVFFRNIVYHLRRCKKVVPPGLMPALLTRFKDQPELWEAIYHQHPELVLNLARENWDWNYMLRVFQPDISLEVGSPGYYTALKARLRMFPLRTSTYIQELFPDASPHQQGRLLDILHDDPSPESRQFIREHVGHGRKPVRLAALRSALTRKEESVYNTVRDVLIRWVKTGEEIKNDGLPATWKRLAELTEEDEVENILIALTDPEDYQTLQTPEFQANHRSALRKAAIFHKAQQTLHALATETHFLLLDTSLIEAMNPKTAQKTLFHFAKNKMVPFNEMYIHLLKRAHPYLSENGSEVIWNRLVEQWNEVSFTLEELPLEILALRIHPNSIKTIWQHRLLQEKSDRLGKVREVLKNRLSFLKKCYR